MAHSPVLLGDLYSYHRMRFELSLRQRFRELADVTRCGGLEPVDFGTAFTVGQRGIPYLAPGVQQPLLGERPL